MIILDENYWLENDSYNWVLKFKAVRRELREGKEVEVTSEDQWYHGELRFALANYVSKVTKVASNVAELIAAVNKTQALVEKVKVYFDKIKNYKPTDEVTDFHGNYDSSAAEHYTGRNAIMSSTAGYIHEGEEVPGFKDYPMVLEESFSPEEVSENTKKAAGFCGFTGPHCVMPRANCYDCPHAIMMNVIKQDEEELL
jgi:hypothetical protein